jgi:hypothetical protein
MVVPNKVNRSRVPAVFDVLANATDEELDEMAQVVVAELDRQAAEHDRANAKADRRGAK